MKELKSQSLCHTHTYLDRISTLLSDMPAWLSCLCWSASWGGGGFSQDSIPRWHIWLFEAGTMVVQAEQERENEGGRAVQQRLHKQRCSPSPGAHGRGSRTSPDLPALPASLTLATIPLVSQQATDFMPLWYFFSLICVICIFSCYKDTVKYVVQCGICWEVIYWQWSLRCKIHTCCCQGFLSKYEQNKMSCSTMAWSFLRAGSARWFRGAIS